MPWYIRWIPMRVLIKLVPQFSPVPVTGSIIKTPDDKIAKVQFLPIEPEENPLRFDGKVYVLIGEKTLSSATAFANAVQFYHLGVLLGEETGDFINGFGNTHTFNLPNTNLTIAVPVAGFVRPGGNDNGRGVLPDYEVITYVEDIIEGRDPVMKYIKDLLKNEYINSPIEDTIIK